MSGAEDDPLYRDPAFARFYDLDNSWTADLATCAALAEDAGSVFDLGCGTGRLGRHLAAQGKRVVGVDPAEAMIDIARAGAEGARARWVVADARGLELGETFDLVVMTGHAFQAFLTPADRRAVLRTVARHLAPGGRFVFDSRNPAREEWREWVPEESRRTLDDPDLGRVEAWNDVEHDPRTGTVTYLTAYRAGGGPARVARARIAFPDRAEIAAALAGAGLAVAAWWGGWNRAPFAPGSPEIIPYGLGAPSPRALRPQSASGI